MFSNNSCLWFYQCRVNTRNTDVLVWWRCKSCLLYFVVFTMNGTMRLRGIQFLSQYSDPTSQEYLTFTEQFCDSVSLVYHPNNHVVPHTLNSYTISIHVHVSDQLTLNVFMSLTCNCLHSSCGKRISQVYTVYMIYRLQSVPRLAWGQTAPDFTWR